MKFRLLLITLLLLLAACGKEPLYQEEGFVFGTRVEVSIYGEPEPRARQAVASVMQEFQRLHDMLHAWKPSELQALNLAFAQHKPATISPELEIILQDASQLSVQSFHLFNPAIGGLVKLWGFQADEFTPTRPDAKQLAALLAAKPQMQDISIRHKTENKADVISASSSNPAVQLDLGGYAKGYALDRAADILRQQGINNALINIGGNVMALGTHGKRPWKVGVQHPRKPGPLATVELHDAEAIGTSGDYQRYFELEGKRYCHLIDPRSGMPVQGVQAVTVITKGAQAGVMSDVLSKPLFIAGAIRWQQVAGDMQLDNAMLIDGKGIVHLTPALQKRLEFIDTNTVVQVAKP